MGNPFEQFTVTPAPALSEDELFDAVAAEKISGAATLTKDDLSHDHWTQRQSAVTQEVSIERPLKGLSVTSEFSSTKLRELDQQVFLQSANFFYEQKRIKSVDVLCRELRVVLTRAGMDEGAVHRLFSGELAPLIKQLATYEQVAMPRSDQAQEEMKLRTRLLATVTARFHKQVGSSVTAPAPIAASEKTEIVSRHVPIRSIELENAKPFESDSSALIKKADDVLLAIVAQVPSYREALAYGTPLEGDHASMRRVALVSVNNILMRGGQLKQKVQLLQSGFADPRVMRGIEKDIAFIIEQEQVAKRAAAEIKLILESKPVAPVNELMPSSAQSPIVNPLDDEITALLAQVSEEDLQLGVPQAEDQRVALKENVALEEGLPPAAVSLTDTGDSLENRGTAERTIKAQAMAIESFKTANQEQLPKTFVGDLDARMEKAGQQIAVYTSKLEEFKTIATPAFIEALPAYQSIMRNMRTAEPLISGDWAEEDSVKDFIVEDKMQKIAANFNLIQKLVTERRADFESHFGEEMTSLRDGMEDAPLPAGVAEKPKKTGWWNKLSLVEEGVLNEDVAVDTTEAGSPTVEVEKVAAFPVGTLVQIPRTSGGRTEATVAAIQPDGSLLVSWMENGVEASKTLPPNQVEPVMTNTYVEPNEAILDSVQDWRQAVAPEVAAESALKTKLQDLASKAEELGVKLEAYIADAPYTTEGVGEDARLTTAATLVASLDGLRARMRAIESLPAAELHAEELNALATQVGEIEYAVKQSNIDAPLGAPVETASSLMVSDLVVDTPVHARLEDGSSVDALVEIIRDDGQITVSWLDGNVRSYQVVPITAISKNEVPAARESVPPVRDTIEDGIVRNFSDNTIDLNKDTLFAADAEYRAAVAAETAVAPELAERSVSLLGLEVPNENSGPFAVRAFREALKLEWLPIKNSTSPGHQAQKANFEAIFKLINYVADTGLSKEEADTLRELAAKITVPERVVGSGEEPAVETPVVEAREGAPVPEAVAVLGSAPEAILSGLERNNQDIRKRLGSLQEKNRDAGAKQWYRRFGLAAALALLATTVAIEKETSKTAVAAGAEASATAGGTAETSSPKVIEGAWPTFDPTAEVEVVAAPEVAPGLSDYVVERNTKKADSLWNIAEGDVEGLEPLPALEGLTELNKTLLLSNMETALRFNGELMESIGLTKINGEKRDPSKIYPGEVVKRNTLNDLLEQIKITLKI